MEEEEEEEAEAEEGAEEARKTAVANDLYRK